MNVILSFTLRGGANVLVSRNFRPRAFALCRAYSSDASESLRC